MQQSIKPAVKQLCYLFVVSIVFGWLIGYPSWTLCIVLAAYLGWHSWQLIKLKMWLSRRDDDQDPPESHGLWGDIFDDIYRLQRRNQKAQDRLKAVLKRVQDSTAALKDGVLMVNRQSNLEWWNAAAGRLLALNQQQDIGNPITNLIRYPEFRAYFERAQYDEPLEIVSPVNNALFLQFHITLFGDEDRLIVCRDISRVKQLEAVRQDFVANASHELRTPLTVISGYLETFLEYKDNLPTRWHRPLMQMHGQSQRMEHLITDLLTLSRLENKQSNEHRAVNVPLLLKNIQTDALALSAEKNHTITLETEDLFILGIESELASAFSNLIFNAVKYTPQDGEICIRWWLDDLGCHLSVSDNGLGIDSVHLPRLTERFYRADPSRHSETGGTGLGLAIVKHALMHHDASLAIHSTLGKGSTFYCHFPMRKVIKPQEAELASTAD